MGCALAVVGLLILFGVLVIEPPDPIFVGWALFILGAAWPTRRDS